MMKMSFERRVQISFLIAVMLVLVIGLFSFFYLNSFNEKVKEVVEYDVVLARSAETVKNQLYDAEQVELTLLNQENFDENRSKLTGILSDLIQRAKEGKKISVKRENKERYEKITDIVEKYQKSMRKVKGAESFRAARPGFWHMIQGVTGEVEKVINDRYSELEEHQKLVKRLQADAQRNMIVIILATFLSGLGLTFIMPKVVVAPFRKMLSALAEARECNFDARVPVEGDDEISEVADSVNCLLEQVKEFDDIKVRRIAFEQRKFDNLSNMVEYGVVLVNREGYVEYVNSQMYRAFNLESEDVIGIEIGKSPLPAELKNLFLETVAKLAKFDNRELTVITKNGGGRQVKEDVLIDCNLVRNHSGDVVSLLFTIEETAAKGQKRLFKKA